MKKRFLSIFAITMMLLVLAGCQTAVNGVVTGKIGQKLQVYWFNMTVISATKVDTYGSYTAGEGNTLIDVELQLDSAFDESVTYWNGEFMIDDPANTEDYIYPLIPSEQITGENLMPSEFTLAPSNSVTYHLVYEVPALSSNFSFIFAEFFDTGTEEGELGQIYSVPLGF